MIFRNNVLFIEGCLGIYWLPYIKWSYYGDYFSIRRTRWTSGSNYVTNWILLVAYNLCYAWLHCMYINTSVVISRIMYCSYKVDRKCVACRTHLVELLWRLFFGKTYPINLALKLLVNTGSRKKVPSVRVTALRLHKNVASCGTYINNVLVTDRVQIGCSCYIEYISTRFKTI